MLHVFPRIPCILLLVVCLNFITSETLMCVYLYCILLYASRFPLMNLQTFKELPQLLGFLTLILYI